MLYSYGDYGGVEFVILQASTLTSGKRKNNNEPQKDVVAGAKGALAVILPSYVMQPHVPILNPKPETLNFLKHAACSSRAFLYCAMAAVSCFRQPDAKNSCKSLG